MSQLVEDLDYESIIKKCSIQDSTLEELRKELEEVTSQQSKLSKVRKDLSDVWQKKCDYNKIQNLKRFEKVRIKNSIGQIQNDLNSRIAKIQQELAEIELNIRYKDCDNFVSAMKENSIKYRNLDLEFDASVVSRNISDCQLEIALYKDKFKNLEEQFQAVLVRQQIERNSDIDLVNFKVFNETYNISSQIGLDINQTKLSMSKKNIDFLKKECLKIEQRLANN